MDELHKLITLALREDVGRGDITTEAIYSGSEFAKAEFVAKEDGIIAGIEVAKHVFSEVNESIRFEPVVKDGARVLSGDIIAKASGPAGSLLTAERTVLNFMQRMSGIATKSRMFADAISHTKAKVLDTRKTIPGHRFTDKWAVKLGGGENHRIGLYDRYLIKENHISVAGSIQAAIQNCVAHRKSNTLSAQIEIEVTSLQELRTALEFSDVDYIMLDNMSVELMKEAVAITAGRCKLEASGNVNLKKIAIIAETGVDFISVGALTHSVKALDISLLFR